jgi:uncharacterized protein YbjT (DUF2867 family)
MSDTIFVTGSTGNVGGNVLAALLEKGMKVRVDVRSKENVDLFSKRGVEVVNMDFNDPKSIESGLKGIEKVFSMTPFVPHLVELGLNFVEAAKKAGVKYIVRLSGMGADAPQPITLAGWHRAVEKAIESSGIAHTFLRPNSYMQNFIAFAADFIKTQNAFYLPQGDGKVSYVDVRDVGAVAVAALTDERHRGKAYTVTGPEALSGSEIAGIFSELTGRTINYVDVPEDAAAKGMREAGMPDALIDALLELYAINEAGYTATVSDAVEKATGRKATSFKQFANDFAAAFK